MDLPPEDHEFKVAVRVLTQDSGLDQAILESLMGEPQRYSDLKALIGDRNDNVLTKALTRLKADGAIQQGLQADLRTKTYKLTPIGKLIIFQMYRFSPHHESIQAYERGFGS